MLKAKTTPVKRSLYQCFNARVKVDKIYCAKGWPLSIRKDGTVDLIRLIRGEPLEFAICQGCVDFDSMGDPVAAKDRGWLEEEVKQWQPKRSNKRAGHQRPKRRQSSSGKAS
jgi:hypothetical protein